MKSSIPETYVIVDALILYLYPREGKLQCSCPRCTSEFSEKNAVKIVQVQTGYVTIETILRTTQGVCCLLVCEPSFLLAAEEGGKLNLWVMNARWR